MRPPRSSVGRAGSASSHDASQHFERGVDPHLQKRAIERATALLLEVAGGKAAALEVLESKQYLPPRHTVSLRSSQLERLLGARIEPKRVESVLTALQMRVKTAPSGWEVTPPSHRFDISIEADLIEEVARLVGFDAIPEREGASRHHFRALPGELPAERSVLETMSARGYHETINYAFVDPQLQLRLFPGARGIDAREPDCKRSVGHAAVAVARLAAGGSRKSTPPAAAH